jgi:hypothetical protein
MPSSGMLHHVVLIRRTTWHNIPEDGILQVFTSSHFGGTFGVDRGSTKENLCGFEQLLLFGKF